MARPDDCENAAWSRVSTIAGVAHGEEDLLQCRSVPCEVARDRIGNQHRSVELISDRSMRVDTLRERRR